MILNTKFNFNSVHIRIHLPELHEETHSHKEVIIHDDHGHGHGGGGHGGGGFAEGLIGGFLSSGGHGDHGGHSQHGGGFGGHSHGGGHGGGGHGHSHGGHSQHGGHGQDDLLIATIGKVICNFKRISSTQYSSNPTLKGFIQSNHLQSL